MLLTSPYPESTWVSQDEVISTVDLPQIHYMVFSSVVPLKC